MTRPPVTHRIVLAKGVKSPSWFSNITLVTEKRKKVFGKNRTVVQLRGESRVAFLPGGIVEVELVCFKKPLVVFGEDEVLYIERANGSRTLDIAPNHHLCPACAANSGFVSSSIERGEHIDVRVYTCAKCDAMWGHNLSRPLIDQM